MPINLSLLSDTEEEAPRRGLRPELLGPEEEEAAPQSLSPAQDVSQALSQSIRPEDWLSLSPEKQTEIIDLANRAQTEQMRQEEERKRIGAIKTTPLGVLGREAVAGVLPAAAAVISSIPGELAGAPAGLPGVIAGGATTGLIGGAAAHDIQSGIAEAIAPEAYKRFQDLIQAGREQHPGYALGGRVAANLPSVKASLPKGVRDVLVRAGLGGTLAGIPAFAEGRLPTKMEALEGAINALALGGARAKVAQPFNLPRKYTPEAPPTPAEIMAEAEALGKVVNLPEKPAPPPAPAPLPPRFDLNAPVMEAAPSGLQMAKPVTRPLPPREGGIPATPGMLKLLPEGALQEMQIPDLVRQPIERGQALAHVEELGQSIRRATDFEKARVEDVKQTQEEARTALLSGKPLTQNQLNISIDSLRKAILENQGKGEQTGILAGSALEKWADKRLGRDPRTRFSLNPIDILAQDIPALAIKGAALLEKGVTKFGDWSDAMIAKHGKGIEPLLKNIYVQSLHMKGGDRPDARSISQATEVHGAMRPQPIEGAGQVPVQEGGKGVLAQAPEGVQESQRANVDDLRKAGEISEKEAQEAQGPLRLKATPGEYRVGQSTPPPEGLSPAAQEAWPRVIDRLNKGTRNQIESFELGDAFTTEADKAALTRLEESVNMAKKEGIAELDKRKEAATSKEEKLALIQQKSPWSSRGQYIQEVVQGATKPADNPQIQEWLATKQAAAPAAEPIRQPSEIPAGEMGIAPRGTAELQSWLNKALGRRKPRTEGGTPELNIESKTPLPDLGDHATNKKVFAEPHGFEAIPYLGALWGGTRRLAGNLNESLTTYWNERQRGQAVASALGHEYSWLDDAFTIKDGNITNVEPKRPGQSIEANAVMESLKRNPDSYKLTPDQRKAVDAIKQLEPDFGVLESKYGLERADYDIGGWEQGIAGKLTSRAESLYRRAAMQRFVNDPAVGGKNRKELEAQLKITHAEELRNGTLTEDSIKRMADSAEASGRVMHPAFFNKIFDEATSRALNKHFPNTNRTMSYAAASINNAIKAAELGFDLGVGFIQGQGLLFTNPRIWGQSIAHSVSAFKDPKFFSNWARKNIDVIREMAQLGSSVGRIAEQDVAGLSKGEVLGRIPGVGKVAGAFGRQFSTFLDVAKVELWKAARETTPKDQWHKTMQSIESSLNMASFERSGIGRKRQLLERVLLLAPAFYRGALNNIAGMAEKGVSGQVSRRAIGSLAVGGSALFYGVATALGMSPEEIMKRFNPARSDFMMWKTKYGGKDVEIGFGGIYRSLLRLIGNMAKTSIEHPENWLSLSTDKNPVTKWARAHSGPVVGRVWDQFSGKDYLGDDTDIRSLGLTGIPSTIRKVVEPLAKGKPLPTARELGASFVGLQAYPGKSATQEIYSKANDYLKSIDQERPKLPPEEEVSYGKLRRALRDGEKKEAKRLMDELIAKKGSVQVKKTMRERSKHPFTGKDEFEKKFKSGLTDKELDLYYKARDEQRDEYEKFLDLL